MSTTSSTRNGAVRPGDRGDPIAVGLRRHRRPALRRRLAGAGAHPGRLRPHPPRVEPARQREPGLDPDRQLRARRGDDDRVRGRACGGRCRRSVGRRGWSVSTAASLIAAGVFRADPALGFPVGTPADAREVSWHGLAHLRVRRHRVPVPGRGLPAAGARLRRRRSARLGRVHPGRPASCSWPRSSGSRPAPAAWRPSSASWPRSS